MNFNEEHVVKGTTDLVAFKKFHVPAEIGRSVHSLQRNIVEEK